MSDDAIIRGSDLYDKMIALKKTYNQPRKGISTGIKSIDEFLLLSKPYLMLITGHPSSGKSEVLDHFAMCTAISNGWSWAYYTPENYPTEEHLKKLIEKYVGKAFWECSTPEIRDAIMWIDEHFIWMYPPDDKTSPKHILTYITKIMEQRHIDAYVLDPWNELDHTGQGGARDDQYISKCLTEVRRFNRHHNLLGTIVIHPRGMPKDKDGKFPVPSLADCHGGSMWRNKADLGVCVHRHDLSQHVASVYVQKVKYKSMGKIGCVNIDYDFKSGRFKDQYAPDFSLPDRPDPEGLPFET